MICCEIAGKVDKMLEYNTWNERGVKFNNVAEFDNKHKDTNECVGPWLHQPRKR